MKLNQDALSEPGQWLVLAVELGETSTVIGEVLLKWTSAADRQGELGFAFARQHHGRGLAAEAAGAIIKLGFGELRLHRITAVCIEENEASARLLRRLGFALEARFVDNVIFKGQWVTQLVYALTEDRWRDESAARGAAANHDVDAVVDLVSRFFVAFTSGKGVDQRLDALRTVMLPEAIVVRTCGQPMAVHDVDSFIAPRRALLTDGSLTNFHEHAVHGRVDVYGDIAHWFGRYTKNGLLHGEPHPGAGMKSVQCVRTPNGWRISAAAWDDDRPGLGPNDHQRAEIPGRTGRRCDPAAGTQPTDVGRCSAPHLPH